MDASRCLTFAVLLGAVVSLSQAVTTESEQESLLTTEETEATTTTSTPRPPPRNCQTARGVAGVCATRQDCDYSVGPIDLSLYKPSWYNSPCADGETCCPFAALVPEPQPQMNEDLDDDFNNDNNNTFIH